jgi:electron transfer flavoprotein beta subunit
MKAKSKPLETITFAALGVEPDTRVKIISTEPPHPRQRGIMVKDTPALFAELQKRGLV